MKVHTVRNIWKCSSVNCTTILESSLRAVCVCTHVHMDTRGQCRCLLQMLTLLFETESHSACSMLFCRWLDSESWDSLLCVPQGWGCSIAGDIQVFCGYNLCPHACAETLCLLSRLLHPTLFQGKHLGKKKPSKSVFPAASRFWLRLLLC